MADESPRLTTAFGNPISDNQNSLTAGPRGPVLMQDYHLIEKMAHFNRERIPERVVHAKGYGAYGTFRLTKSLAEFTRAKVLTEVGKEVPMVARFSTVGGESGSADTARDPRGFALKFYTQEGNWDLVGNNTPIFFVRDAIKFSDFIRTQKRDPRTHLKPHWRRWDFWGLSPEAIHQVMILYSDRGTPVSARFMHGYGSHTFSLWNDRGERYWVKFHFHTKQGIQNFTADEADEVAGKDSDYSAADLSNAIETGDFPKWKVSVQIMPELEADTYRINPFDLTKVWPHGDYPLIEIGEMELNRNPDNYFAEIEQSAFEPSNVVPGIGFSLDKMLQNRVLSYADAHRYRLGVNYQQIPVNQAKNAPVQTYHRDGVMRTDGNHGAQVDYEPNSFGGPNAGPFLRRAAPAHPRRCRPLRLARGRRGSLRPAAPVLDQGAGRGRPQAARREHRHLDGRQPAHHPGADDRPLGQGARGFRARRGRGPRNRQCKGRRRVVISTLF